MKGPIRTNKDSEKTLRLYERTEAEVVVTGKILFVTTKIIFQKKSFSFFFSIG